MDGVTLCPAGCGRTQKPGTFLCAPCWHKLPSRVRGTLTRAWHDLGLLDKIRSPVAYRAAIRNYRLARKPAQFYQGCIYAWNAFREEKAIKDIRCDTRKSWYAPTE